MSKQLTPKELHPVLFEAFNRYQMGAAFITNAEGVRAHRDFSAAWSKAYSKHLWWIAGASVGTGFGGGFLANMAHNPKFVGLGILAGLVSFFGFCGAGLVMNMKRATPEEIEALLPVLELTPVQRAYCLAVVVVYKSNLISDIDRDQIRTALTALMDQADKLEKELEGQNMMNVHSGTLEIQQELRDVEARISETLDPEVVKTLDETRGVIARRLNRAERKGTISEKAASQIELIRQTFLSFAEEFASTAHQNLPSAPSSEFSSQSDLRKMLYTVQEQTAAVSKAVDEIRSLN